MSLHKQWWYTHSFRFIYGLLDFYCIETLWWDRKSASYHRWHGGPSKWIICLQTNTMTTHHQKFWSICSRKVWSITTKSGWSKRIWVGQKMWIRFGCQAEKSVIACVRAYVCVTQKALWQPYNTTQHISAQLSLYCVNCEACGMPNIACISVSCGIDPMLK